MTWPATESYREGLTIAEQLAKSDPDNAGWQRDLTPRRRQTSWGILSGLCSTNGFQYLNIFPRNGAGKPIGVG
jgi:hypothetical protein